MAQPTNIYVDPSIAADSGAGTVGDPYGDLEYAIEQTTFDTTNGTQVNIKAGTDEILVAELSVAMADTGTTAAWTPTWTRPCVFRGYTTVANDGGIGGISGGGSVSVYNDTALDVVHFIDLHCHNTGSNIVIQGDDYITVINCEIDNTTGNGIVVGRFADISSNYIHNIGGVGVKIDQGWVGFNYFENGTNDFSIAIDSNAIGEVQAIRNIIKIDGASDGIGGNYGSIIVHNSIWSNSGTGSGIVSTANNQIFTMVTNNVVEGFSGTGGVGFDFDASGVGIRTYGGNAAYNNATNYAAPSDYVMFELGGAASNEVLSASPFTDATNGDFNPVDTGSVKEGSLPDDFGNGV